MGKTIFITGGTGYVGRAICKELAGRGHHLHILYRNEKKIQKDTFPQDCSFWKGDLLDLRPLEEKISSADVVIHLAADVRMYSADGNISRINVTGTENLLKLCSRFNKKFHFIFFSSIEANGPSENRITKLSDTPRPLWEYGESKLAGEKLVKEYAEKYDFNYTILRLGNVYDGTSGGLKAFLHSLKENGKQLKFLYYFLGSYTLHFIHRKEIALSLNAIMENKNTLDKTYFLASESYSIKEILNVLLKASHMRKPNSLWKLFWYPAFQLTVTRKTDGLIRYICEGGRKRIFRTYDISANQKDFNFKTQNLFMSTLNNEIE